jgi:hypothetical protein
LVRNCCYRDASYKFPDRWPDWKSRENSKRPVRESKKILGKMYRTMSEAIHQLNNNRKPQVFKKSEKIEMILSYCDNDIDLILQLKEKAQLSIKCYITNRRQKESLPKEEFYQWQRDFCQNQRRILIINKKLDPNRVAFLQVALIYQQCICMEEQDATCMACEYAWLVCREELLQIFAGENSLTVSCQSQKFVLRR